MTELFVLAKCQNDVRDGFYLITFLKVSTLHPMIITPLHNLDIYIWSLLIKRTLTPFGVTISTAEPLLSNTTNAFRISPRNNASSLRRGLIVGDTGRRSRQRR